MTQPGTSRERIKVCPHCIEPVIFTLEFPGAEHHCPSCGWSGGVFDVFDAQATPDLIQRRDAVEDTYEAARVARGGTPARPVNQDAPRPACDGCGTPATGRLDGSGKPPHWFSRTRDGTTSYACSRGCIPSNEMVMPW